MADKPPVADRIAAPPRSVSRDALLEAGSDARFRQLVSDLFTVSVRMEAVRDALAEDLGVSGPQYSILMAIAHLGAGQGVTVTRVAEQLHVTGAFVTVEAGKLVGGVLVEKTPNPDDGRSVLLRLTARGSDLLDRIAAKVRDVNDRFFGALDREAFATLTRIAADLVRDSEPALQRARWRPNEPNSISGRAGAAPAVKV